MAKHQNDGKGFVSKGLRRSSVKTRSIKAVVAVPETKQVNSVLRQAFDDILMRNVSRSAITLAMSISDSLQRSVGLVGIGKGWNASLSFKTAKKIGINEGCTNPRVRMPYDEMVAG